MQYAAEKNFRIKYKTFSLVCKFFIILCVQCYICSSVVKSKKFV